MAVHPIVLELQQKTLSLVLGTLGSSRLADLEDWLGVLWVQKVREARWGKTILSLKANKSDDFTVRLKGFHIILTLHFNLNILTVDEIILLWQTCNRFIQESTNKAHLLAGPGCLYQAFAQYHYGIERNLVNSKK